MKTLCFPCLPILASLACNALTGRVDTIPSTATLPPPPTTPAPATPEPPAYIPPACETTPLATVPPATTVAEPTPSLDLNPEIDTETQLRVFDDHVATINEVYLYPDFNGVDWTGIVASYRSRVEAGLDTESFYAEMGDLVAQLGDEHSSFESPVQVAQAEAELAGQNDYVGIGTLVQPYPERGVLTILVVFPESAAFYAGLRSHDNVLEVDGQPIIQDGLAYPHWTRGPECSAVVLTVQSPGEAPRRVTLVRFRVSGSLPIDARLVPTTDGSRVGYIFLPTFFDETVTDQVRQALEAFGPLDGLILDNRMNSGGSSSVVEPLLGFFTSGLLGHFVSRTEERPLEVEGESIHNSQDVPLVVLIGEDTISFGEIFSGALMDIGRAQLVGEPTLGNVETLHGYTAEDGSRIWIAEERFVPVNSQADWEKEGIVPVVEAGADWETFTFETDPGLAAALELLGHE
ncbi:MAG TPA: S41 family peptidase [Anaerolineales bacterium]|nr:S41 family peptidase [Anaerolineales bacterium]